MNFLTGFFLGRMTGENRQPRQHTGNGDGLSGLLTALGYIFGLIGIGVLLRYLYVNGYLTNDGTMTLWDCIKIPFALEYYFGITGVFKIAALHVGIGIVGVLFPFFGTIGLFRLFDPLLGKVKLFDLIFTTALTIIGVAAFLIGLINLGMGLLELLAIGISYIFTGKV